MIASLSSGYQPEKEVPNEKIFSEPGYKSNRSHVLISMLEKEQDTININPPNNFHFYEDIAATWNLLRSKRSFVKGSLKTCQVI